MLRVRVEFVLAALLTLATVATVIWPTWIEDVLGLEPDGGTGESEWWIVVLLVAVTVAAWALAGRDYRAVRRRPGDATA